jgi:hypothetical protein
MLKELQRARVLIDVGAGWAFNSAYCDREAEAKVTADG